MVNYFKVIFEIRLHLTYGRQNGGESNHSYRFLAQKIFTLTYAVKSINIKKLKNALRWFSKG